MKNYQIVITGIVAFSVGVMAGPGIQESIEYARLHKEKDILYSSQDSRFLNETNGFIYHRFPYQINGYSSENWGFERL